MEIGFKIADVSDIKILVQLIKEFHEFEYLPFEDSTIRTLLAQLLFDDSL